MFPSIPGNDSLPTPPNNDDPADSYDDIFKRFQNLKKNT